MSHFSVLLLENLVLGLTLPCKYIKLALLIKFRVRILRWNLQKIVSIRIQKIWNSSLSHQLMVLIHLVLPNQQCNQNPSVLRLAWTLKQKKTKKKLKWALYIVIFHQITSHKKLLKVVVVPRKKEYKLFVTMTAMKIPV